MVNFKFGTLIKTFKLNTVACSVPHLCLVDHESRACSPNLKSIFRIYSEDFQVPKLLVVYISILNVLEGCPRVLPGP